jgi:hypothetical protein
MAVTFDSIPDDDIIGVTHIDHTDFCLNMRSVRYYFVVAVHAKEKEKGMRSPAPT